MMKQEFEELIQKEITKEEYDLIEMIYTTYPGIHDVYGKKQVADLYKVYGIRIFEDMLPRAEKIYQLEMQILDKKAQISQLEKELQKL